MASIEEQAEGERFGIKVVYNNKPLSGNWTYLGVRETRNLLDAGLAFSGERRYPNLSAHRTTTLEVSDKRSGLSIGVLAMLPISWRIVTVVIPDNSTRLPLRVYPENRLLSFPVTRITGGNLGVDLTVEQLIHNVGASHAYAEGISDILAVFGEGRRFLRSTFKGPLLLDITVQR